MTVRDLIPWGRNGGSRNDSSPAPWRDGEPNPFAALHREMNRLFDEAFRSFDAPSLFGPLSAWPSLEIGETDQEVRVAAELPGMDENDVEVLLSDGALVIRGEKRAETEDKERQFSERFYGRFERRIPLGFEVEEDKIAATFRNGVLTVTLPKPANAREKAKRIPITAEGRQ
jgi:HSP20 family protein